MAEFGTKATDLAAPSGAGAQVVGPAQTNLDLGFVDSFKALFKKEAGKADMAILSDYAQQVDKINQGLETGDLRPEVGTATLRKTYSRYIASAPHLVDDFKKITEGARGFAQVGEAERQLTEDRAMRKEQLSMAAKDGWVVLPGMTEQEQNKLMAVNATRIQSERAMKEFYAQQEYARANGRYTQENADREYKTLSVKLLAESTGVHIEALGAVADSLRRQVQANPKFAADAQAELAKQVSVMEGKLQAVAGINPELASGYRSILSNLREAYKGGLDPTKQSNDDLKRLEDEVQMIKLRAQRMALTNTKVQGAYAVNTLLSNSPSAALASSSAGLDIMTMFSTMDVSDPSYKPQMTGNPEAEKDVLKMAQAATSALLQGKYTRDPKLSEQQVLNLNNNILSDIGNLIRTPGKLTPKELTNALDYVSSPEFGKLSAQGNLNAQARSAVAQVFNAGINQPAVQALDKQFTSTVYLPKATGGDAGRIALGDAVSDVIFDGAGVKFKGYKGLNPEDLGTFTRATESSERAINKVVRAAAHLEGHTDYQKAWEKLRPQLLPSMYNAPEAIKVGTKVKSGDTTYEYLGGPDAKPTSWRKLASPTPSK